MSKRCYYCDTEFENNGSPFVECPNCGWCPADEENY
jgi:DNA-directed RNA polymerase subunit RPC12/RpoP